MILPIVKKQTEHGGVCAVPTVLTYGGDSELSALGGDAFAAFVGGATRVQETPFVTFCIDDTLEAREEIYRVTVLSDRIQVGFRDVRGAVNGAATVALLLRKPTLSCCEILDYPDFGYRSFLLDFARGVPTEEEIFSTIRSMALAKYNRLHLHLIDSFGPCYISDALPKYKLDAEKGEPCQKALLREIVKACKRYAIEIIPELEIPAHAWALTQAHPEFLCPVEGNQGWTICPGNDAVWPFFEALVEELVELFPESEYLHIGTDELEFRDLDAKYYCYWDTCPRCAALRAREGLADRQAEFYYVIQRMYEIVTSHGKRMMMWNDQIDVTRDVPLPRDILMQFWRIAAPGRGPFEGCSMEKLLEQGFCLVNSFYPYTYTDCNHYFSPEKSRIWHPAKLAVEDTSAITSEPSAYPERILGGEGCAWEFGNRSRFPFLAYVIPPVLGIVGDKLWDRSDREHTQAYRAALSEYLFGTDALTCIFDAIGDLVPPRKVDFYIAKWAPMPSVALVEECLAKLRAVEHKACLTTKNQYVALFEKILEQSKACEKA